MSILDPKRSAQGLRCRLLQRGFTLVELVMVIILLGVLSVYAVPRMLDLNAWRLRAFADQLQSTTAAMQRLALAQRRPVMATFTTAGVSYDYVPATGVPPGAAINCPSAVPACLTVASAGTATFNALNAGNTVTAPATLTISVTDGTSTQISYRLENDTGLMRRWP
jgi:prepilin-type N-terminal cleavage/methylation domain-containing protein